MQGAPFSYCQMAVLRDVLGTLMLAWPWASIAAPRPGPRCPLHGTCCPYGKRQRLVLCPHDPNQLWRSFRSVFSGWDGSLSSVFCVKMMIILFVNLFWSFRFVLFAHFCN